MMKPERIVLISGMPKDLQSPLALLRRFFTRSTGVRSRTDDQHDDEAGVDHRPEDKHQVTEEPRAR